MKSAEQTEIAPKRSKKDQPWGEGKILQALRARFDKPAHAFFPHVRNQTGYARTVRTADAIAMSLWPSRGLLLTGIEIKSSRADWVRELEDPSKAEEIAQHCDLWILAVGDREIVQPGELPPSWGLMAPKGDKLVTCVEASVLGDRGGAISRSFVAAVLRRAMEDSPTENQIAEAVAAAKAEWDEDRAKSQPWEVRRADERADDLRKRIERFKAASGIDIERDWNHGRIGDAVRALVAIGNPQHLLNSLRADARNIGEAIEAVGRLSDLGPAKDGASP